jgi:protein gp37
MTRLALSLIVRDPEVQPRESMNHDLVTQYAEDMLSGIDLPPVVVFHDGDRHWLAEGFHRTEGAEQAGLEDIEADIRPGTREDALWHAAGSNKEHDVAGQRRKKEDKDRAVRMAIQCRPNEGGRALARHCGVHRSTVDRVREELRLSGAMRQINDRNVSRTRNGTSHTYTMQVGNKGRPTGPVTFTPHGVIEYRPTAAEIDAAADRLRAVGAEPFFCPACGDVFSDAVWHCPGCDHHCLDGVEDCKYCHDYERRPDGSIVRIEHDLDPDELDEPDEPEADPPPADDPPADPPVDAPAAPLFVLDGEPEPPGPPKPPGRPTFNQTNEMVEWAWWTWNPVTGCEHTCIYCYARDIANRFYPEKFAPTYRPERLEAPRNTHQPEKAKAEIGWRNVFVCSMADLFGRWVPEEWIEGVFASCRRSPEWNYLFLTKFPNRYEDLDFPATAWVGTSVDEQRRVANAEKAFAKVRGKVPVTWLSVEPLREPLKFTRLDLFDWIVIGGQSRSSQAPEFLPPFAWVADLVVEAKRAGCKVYIKPNIGFDGPTRPREYPGAAGPEGGAP